VFSLFFLPLHHGDVILKLNSFSSQSELIRRTPCLIFTMPGPKMGPRPTDFDEEIIRQSPTFIRWLQLERGHKLRYACREFVKDHGDDEERLMRRIMIARRNNIRDHETLKRARRQTKPGGSGGNSNSNSNSNSASNTAAKAAAISASVAAAAAAVVEENRRNRRPPTSFSDNQVEKEMDAPAVEATRSYRSWMGLPDGAEFVYNQKYIKGREGHDWLLRKNIWRRMRYRRENKKMVERLKDAGELVTPQHAHQQQQHQHQLMASQGQGMSDQLSKLPSDSATTSGTATKQEPTDNTGMHSHDMNNTDNDHMDTSDNDHANNDNNNNDDPNDAATHAAAAAAATSDHLADPDAVEAAVAAAESFGISEAAQAAAAAFKSQSQSHAGLDDDDDDDMHGHVHNPLEAAVAQAAALDAAAQLAAATHQSLDEDGLPKQEILEHEANVCDV
jgi:hypothetical protein